MSRWREVIAALIRPAPEPPPFAARTSFASPPGLRRSLTIGTIAIVALGVGAWLLKSCQQLPPDEAMVIKPPPKPAPQAPIGRAQGFPQHYTLTNPLVTPAEAAPPPSDDGFKRQMRAELDVMSAALQALNKQLEGIHGELKKPTASDADERERRQRELQEAQERQRQAAAEAAERKRKAEAEAQALFEARGSPHFYVRKRGKEASGDMTYQKNPYSLSSGWMLPVEFETEITNQAPGIAKFWVTRDVFDSATGQHLLVPAGSYGLVRVSTGQVFGTNRLSVSVLSLTWPNGDRVKLNTAHAGDAKGAAGLSDLVDRRYGMLFASILLQGVLRGGSMAMMGRDSMDPTDAMAQAVAQETAQQGGQAARQVIDTSPIFTIRQGYLGEIRLEEPLTVGRSYPDALLANR